MSQTRQRFLKSYLSFGESTSLADLKMKQLKPQTANVSETVTVPISSLSQRGNGSVVEWSLCQKGALATVTCALLVANALFVRHSVSAKNRFPYNVVALSACVEVLKLFICVFALIRQHFVTDAINAQLNALHSQQSETEELISERPAHIQISHDDNSAKIDTLIIDAEIDNCNGIDSFHLADCKSMECSKVTESETESIGETAETRCHQTTKDIKKASQTPTALESIVASLKVRTSVGFLIPSVLYAVDNNCWFVLFLFYRPSAVLLLQNLSYLFTALFRWAVIGVRMTAVQWHVLLLICFGAISAGLLSNDDDNGTVHSGHKQNTENSDETNGRHSGGELFIAGLVLCSSLAGVWSEKVIRNENAHLPVTVIGLHFYTYGAIVNILAYFFIASFIFTNAANDSDSHFPPFWSGLSSPNVVSLVTLNAVIGLCYAFIFRQLGSLNQNIVRGSTIVFVFSLEILLFGHSFSVVSLMSVCTVITAVSLWSLLNPN